MTFSLLESSQGNGVNMLTSILGNGVTMLTSFGSLGHFLGLWRIVAWAKSLKRFKSFSGTAPLALDWGLTRSDYQQYTSDVGIPR